MGIVNKILWYVETHLDHPVTLTAMARDLGVSRFHLARSFAVVTGQAPIRYLWRRRLSRAALALTAGAPVTEAALDALYASPEAFSRAFRAEFGLTPRALKQRGGLDGLALTQPLEFEKTMTLIFDAPRIETFPTRHLAGPVRRYSMQTRAAIPAQWVAYNTEGERAPSLSPEDYYGLAFGFSEATGEFDYLCGQEVAADVPLPEGFARVATPAGRWARFVTRGHVSTMQSAWGEVYNHWMGQPGCLPRKGPSVEYYPPAFNGMTGHGGYELWVPVEG